MRNAVKLEVTGFDNRSGEEPGGVMFGFVYFSDELRVAYTNSRGVLGNTTGGWPPVTTTHVRLAKEYLDSEVPGWYTPVEETTG
jgi:hypothetical protein